MNKEYIKTWKKSLIKETFLIGFLLLIFSCCMYILYNTPSSRESTVLYYCAVLYNVGTVITLDLWSNRIKNDHELACYRGTTLTLWGSMFVWLAGLASCGNAKQIIIYALTMPICFCISGRKMQFPNQEKNPQQ